jgi:spore coat-associated protein N
LDRISTRRRTHLLLLAAAGLAVMSMTGLGMSLAIFTDTTTVPSNVFTAGTVSITTDHTASAVVTYSNMAPGDQVTSPLLVTNNGSLQLRYAVSSAATNTDGKGLKDQLVLTVKSGVITCTTAGFGGSGTILYSGDLDASPPGNLIGDPSSGADTGDRALASAASESLCWNVRLPVGSGNAFQAATTTATFTFAAEQTANN